MFLAIEFKINRKNIESCLEAGEKLNVFLSLDGGGVRGLILNRVYLLEIILRIFLDINALRA